jgi:sec-independent protein translocase protein TatA
MGLGAPEIIVIVLILLLLFGGKKIPELMRGLGSGMKEFKKATNFDDEPEPRRSYDRQIDTQSSYSEAQRVDEERRRLEEERRRLDEERREFQARQQQS